MSVRSSLGKKISKIQNPKVFGLKEIDLIIPNPIVSYLAEFLQPIQVSPHFSHNKPQNGHAGQVDNIDDNGLCIDDLPLSATIYDIEVRTCTQIIKPEEYLRFENTSYNDLEFIFQCKDIVGEIIKFIFEPIEIIQDINFIPIESSNVITISDNLIKSIIPNYVTVRGKNYADKYWQETKIHFSQTMIKNECKAEIASVAEKNETPTEDQQRATKIENVTKNSNTIWDLIYVILLPPLTIDSQSSPSMPFSLYRYQVDGVNFLYQNDHALLADDMGTGKTVMAIMALRLLFREGKVHHGLILCPKSVLYEWSRHLDMWAPELHYIIVRGLQNNRTFYWDARFHIYLTTYDTFALDMEHNENALGDKFDLVIVDEAHHIKNPRSKRYRSLKKLGNSVRWALTGTPIQNTIEDLYSIFDFIYPQYISKTLRSDVYFPIQEEIIREKIAPYFLRRKKSDVLSDLPPKQRQEYWLELDDEQKQEYLSVEGRIQQEISELDYKSPLFRGIFRNKLIALKQICNFASNKIASPKTELLLEQVEEIVSGENKVIVFTQFVENGVDKITNFLKKHYDAAIIKGDQSDAERKRQIELFKRNKDVPVLVASVRAGGEGLNLTEASYVVHFDHWWNPAVMWQAEDRVHRRGQTKGVNVYSYWMKNTVDERIHQILTNKNILANIIDQISEESIDQILTLDDMLSILGYHSGVEDQTNENADNPVNIPNLLDVSNYLLSISPSSFEQIISEFMKSMGYPIVKVIGTTGDGGIDIICSKSNSPDDNETIAVQCKRFRGNVGVKIAREFLGALQDNNVQNGFLITTGDFTKDCSALCQRSGKIKTINGSELSKYMIQFGLYQKFRHGLRQSAETR